MNSPIESRCLFFLAKNHLVNAAREAGVRKYQVAISSPFWKKDLIFYIKATSLNPSTTVDLDSTDFPPVKFGKVKIGDVQAEGSVDLSDERHPLIKVELKGLRGPVDIREGEYQPPFNETKRAP